MALSFIIGPAVAHGSVEHPRSLGTLEEPRCDLHGTRTGRAFGCWKRITACPRLLLRPYKEITCITSEVQSPVRTI